MHVYMHACVRLLRAAPTDAIAEELVAGPVWVWHFLPINPLELFSEPLSLRCVFNEW